MVPSLFHRSSFIIPWWPEVSYHSSLFAFLEKYDVILCPVSPYPTPVHGVGPNDEQTLAWSYLAAYAMTELPTVVVRVGASPEGLPISVQIVAREWREDVALAVAQHLQIALGGWQLPQTQVEQPGETCMSK